MGVASLILGLYAFTGIGALVAFSMGHLIDPMTLVYAAIYCSLALALAVGLGARHLMREILERRFSQHEHKADQLSHL